MAECVEITVARALTRLKIARDRIEKDLNVINTMAGIHSKELSQLSNEKELGRNHKDAAVKILAVLQSIGSLQSYIVTVKTAIQQSNLVTMIHSDVFGDISIAAALVMTTELKASYQKVQSAARSSAQRAENKANVYNSQNFSKASLESISPTVLEEVLAKPMHLLTKEDMDVIDNNVIAVNTELNELINESNAVTLVKIPDVQIL